jgi:hypothetical protein
MSTRRNLAGTFLLVATVGGASIAAAQREPDTAGSTTTVVGCVQRTDQPGTLGTTIPERTATPEPSGIAANLGEPGPGFILINAMPATTAGASKEPSGESSRAAAPKRFILFGSEGELGRHEGHRVQVSGTIEPSTKPAESGAIATSGSNQLTTGTDRLKVTSIEMIAGDCTVR